MVTFEEAKVGDRAYCLDYGWGEIVSLNHSSKAHNVYVDFKDKSIVGFLFNGRPWYSSHQTLFWDEVKIVPPDKPKEKCEVCERIEFLRQCTNFVGGHDIEFLLNQHHTCEKKGGE